MANFDGYGKAEEVVFSSFGGLKCTGPLCDKKHCFELRNMRLTPDGTLVRREGFVPLVSFDDTVRGVFCIERNGQREAYAVAGSAVYYLQMEQNACTPHFLGSIGSHQGEVHFFCYDGRLLLLDGQEIWVMTPDRLDMMKAYVPLYGKDWSPDDNGSRTVYEAPNVLCRQLRIRFCLERLTSTYHFGTLPVISVDRMYVNGELYENGYVFNAEKRTVEPNNGYNVGTVIEMIVTVKDGFGGDRASVAGATHAVSIGNAEDERLLFYGGSVATGCLRMSRRIDASHREQMRAMDEDICMLYLTEQDTLTLGNGMYAVTGACRHYDRTLIFTERGTWMADDALTESGMLRLILVNTSLGCSCAGSYAVIGNEPITLMGRTVLRWNSKTDERNECNAQVISSDIEPLLDEAFGKQAACFTDTGRGEVWFYTPDKPGRILIRDEQNECWTSFDGFVPSGIFDAFDRVGFFSGATVFVFDPSAMCDTDAQGVTHGIEAELMSGFLDFGHAGRIKRMVGVTVIADCGEQSAELVLQRVSGREKVILLRGGGEVSVMQARACSGRFRYLRFGVRCSSVGKWHLHGVRLTAR